MASSLVVCGNPDFYQANTSGIQSIKELPGAEKEASIIESIVKPSGTNVTKFLNGQITEDTLKKLKNPSIFHIATHGYFKETTSKNDDDIASNPLLNSGLLLSGSGDILDNHENPYVNQKDGILTAYEALDLNFDNTDLVVLSACETGRGDVQVGEGVFGLQRSFLVAGAKSLIISLFKVNDEVTQTLMKTFYEKWLTTGNIRQSFIEAKKEIKKQYPEPIYWGSFVMIEGKPSTQVGLVK